MLPNTIQKLFKPKHLYNVLYTNYILVIGDFLSDVTTIQIEKKVVNGLKEVKQYPRQTYSELLQEMTIVFKNCKAKENQYDEFLHKIQQNKMKELWDNKEDEAWEKA